MRTGLIAKKLGMTRFFRDDGSHVPVTLLMIEKNYITGIKDSKNNSYKQLQIAAGNIKMNKIKKPIKNFFAKLKIEPKKKLLEFKISKDINHNIGDTLDSNFFKVGQYVDLIGKSIGKGFAGSMKRHNFSGLRASHGVSISHRSHGSTGQCQDPGRTFKGKKMAGQMGFKKVSIHNLEVVQIDNDDGIISVKGAVPGSIGSFLVIRDAIKPKSLTVKIKKINEEISESSKKPVKASENENKEKGGDEKKKDTGDKK